MKNILLIITDNKTRQLYPEILLSKGIEVIPIADLSTAIMLLSLNQFNLAVLDADQNPTEVEVFLRLRQKHHRLSKTKFIILSQNNDFNPKITKIDFIIYTSQTPIKNIINQIEQSM